MTTKPLLMGILNVTPDSFSDGGLHFHLRDAVNAANRMIDEGADIIDIGGESTRPGSDPVNVEEELRRTIPVIEALAGRSILSIDTSKPEVAAEAVAAGATIVNDVRALSAPGFPEVCARARCIVCLMHMKGEPKTMQIAPTYDDVVGEVRSFLLDRAIEIEAAGVPRPNIWIDPGIGFGKTTEHNLTLLHQLDSLTRETYPVLVGVSRKAFIGKTLGKERTPLTSEQRLEGTLAAQVMAQSKGARIIRAHDILATRRAIEMTHAILNASS